MSEARIPMVKTRRAGRVTTSLETLAEAYRKNNAEMDCRYVYDPQHKPELSNVLSRLSQGYAPVKGKDLGAEMMERASLKEEDTVRVADLVLMGIPAAEKRELEKEIAEANQEQIRSIDRNFREAIEGIAVEGRDGSTHRSRAVGRSVIEEKEFEFDYTQRTGEEASE